MHRDRWMVDGWMGGWIGEWMSGWEDGCIGVGELWIVGKMDGGIDR